MSPGGWGRSVAREEEEGKVLMKILPERKRSKTGIFGFVAHSGQGFVRWQLPESALYIYIRPVLLILVLIQIKSLILFESWLILIMIYVLRWTSSPDLSEALLPMQPSDVLDMPVDPNEPTYCLCHQVSYGEMIGCDNPDVGFPSVSLLLKLNVISFFISGPVWLPVLPQDS